jgi:CRP-like cAMP-binding protein
MIDVFEGLNLKNLRDLLEISNEETYVEGQVVIKEGTIGFKWYIILKGSAKISFEKLKIPSRDINVGDYFGEGALSQVVGRRTAT